MVYTELIKQIKKNFYIVSVEKFKSETANSFLERYTGKHLLLKPELLILNDQPFGFKQINSKLKALEKYPIYIELEYADLAKKTKVLHNFELYCEIKIKKADFLLKVKTAFPNYKKYLSIEKVSNVFEPKAATLLVFSKLNEIFEEEFLEESLEENTITMTEINNTINCYLVNFRNFIKKIYDLANETNQIEISNNFFAGLDWR
jgi:hypothetical protein